HDCRLASCTTTERGPPATHDQSSTANAALGPRSLGTLACPDRPRNPATYNYDGLGRFVQTARGSRSADTRVGRPEWGSAVDRRSDVAANGGSKIPWTSWQN